MKQDIKIYSLITCKLKKAYYQTGTAEYAEVQTSCLCKFYNCLQKSKTKKKRKSI